VTTARLPGADGRLFDLEEYPEVPIFRPPTRRRSEGDARFRGEYPSEWHRCPTCDGSGRWGEWRPSGILSSPPTVCSDCLGMGSLKGRVRLEAGHRCLRCLHPYVPKADAERLGVEPSWRGGGWSPCDERCTHGGPMRYLRGEEWIEVEQAIAAEFEPTAEAAWRILTVHHADGDKGNVRWWNLLSLCQRCHLEIQAKVVLERVYPHEHSAWFRPFVAGYYATVYLGEELSRFEVEVRLDELLALERA